MLEFDLRKNYRGFSLEVSAAIGNEWLVLLAPSGGGKSLCLNLLAGLVRPDTGHVRLGKRTLYDQKAGIQEPIRNRRIGYVFQNYALFPHMTVAENVAYGLEGGNAGNKVARWLGFFHMGGKEDAYPRQLSGGQQQRVALARALAVGPDLLLLDEPLSALDRPTRETLQRDLAALKSELSIPVVLVTHDFQEAQTLGDQVMVLDSGRVVEAGTKKQLFQRPSDHRTARFLGVENIFSAILPEGGRGEKALVGQQGFDLQGASPDAQQGAVHLCIRASDVRLAINDQPRPNRLSGVVDEIVDAHGVNLFRISVDEIGGQEMVMQLDHYVRQRYKVTVGSKVQMWLPPDKLFLCH